MSKYVRFFLLLVALSIASISTSAVATIATAPLVVSATVLSVCGVLATPLAFGNYSVTSATPTSATAIITATCTAGVPYTLSLDGGTGTGGTVATRVMMFGTNKLNYKLYSDAGHTTLWGDGTLSTTTVSGTAALLPQTYTVYGQIPASQQSGAGVYADTVTVTLTY